jgi:hypothetical protein
MKFTRHELLGNDMLPVDIVLGPAWWHRHTGITFDEDFFFHPARRVEVERRMEQVLYDRWGRYGLGTDRDKDLPSVGAVHLAAGYLVSELLGCEVRYTEAAPPQVVSANMDLLEISPGKAFQSPVFKRLEKLFDALKKAHGYLHGDINWGGVLNVALDLRGQQLFMDMIDKPVEVNGFISGIRDVIEQFTRVLARETGTTSISVNRVVNHLPRPVVLHSECTHTMISVADYERHLMHCDVEWSRKYRPYGIHYCGEDPHRYAETFAKLPHLDFLDVGWGGDVACLREHLPRTFLNIRYSPVEIVHQSEDDIRRAVRRLVQQSGNPYLTGVCCINLDDQVRDEQIDAIFDEVAELRREYAVQEA